MNVTAIILTIALGHGASPTVPHFDTQIVPVLTKAGCNSGACHGAAAGRGGFRLSLWGGDPSSDWDAIVHALEGRRINLARPTESLLILKPTGQLRHGGKTVLAEDGPGSKLLIDWIAAGALRGVTKKLTHFAVSSSKDVVERPDAEIRLKAQARFDNGPEVDVTAWTVFTSSDPSGVTLKDTPTTTAIVKRRGQHILIARFLDRVESVRLTRPLGDQPVDLSAESKVNWIDEEILRVLTVLRMPVSPPADDAAFLRRVRLDLTGTLPKPAELNAYLADTSKDKKNALVDRLLQSDEFADYWTLRCSRMLKVHSLPNDKQGTQTYTNWLKRSLREGMPLNQWAQQLLTSTGDSHEVGPANFHRMANNARGEAELVSRVFMGARLQCANCHNHPLDRWTQDDYHGLAAVFARLNRGRVVNLTGRGGVTNLRTGEPAMPRIPGIRDLDGAADPIKGFAHWLTEPDNPHFAKAQVNRLWRAMFGRGLVDPVDDMRVTNPSTHPQLLDRLADDFVRHKYDLRHTLRLIALSQTYGRSERSVKGNESDDRFYARAYRRELEPEVLADAIAEVTGVPGTYPGLPKGTRAITIYDPLSPAPALDVLGRCSRIADCVETTTSAGLPAKLHLLNGELINARITDKTGRLARLIADAKSNRDIVVAFYSLGFGREPREHEMKYWMGQLAKADANTRTSCLEDFVWALLNSREFTTNH